MEQPECDERQEEDDTGEQGQRISVHAPELVRCNRRTGVVEFRLGCRGGASRRGIAAAGFPYVWFPTACFALGWMCVAAVDDAVARIERAFGT